MRLYKYLILFSLLSIILLANGCRSSSNTTATNAANDYNSISKNNFDFSLLSSIQTKNSNQNICISPISFKMALLLAYNGADGQTKSDILQSLNLKNEPTEKVNINFQNTLKSLNYSNDGIVLNVVNAIWASDELKSDNIFSQYSRNIKNYNLSDINFLNFREKNNSSQTVNNWVSKNTNKKIRAIVSPDELSDDLVAIITNAVYFNGKWDDPFEKRNTKEKDFFVDNQVIKCQMMSKHMNTRYFENNKYQSIEIPYKNYASLYVFLPSKNINITDFVKDMKMSDIDNKIHELTNREGNLELPKFKSEFKTEVPFSGDNNFSKIASIEYGKVAISKIVQKTFIDLGEEGTEAAAATAIYMDNMTAIIEEPPKPFNMVVDRPFFYLIIDHNTKEVIFMGIVNNPNI